MQDVKYRNTLDARDMTIQKMLSVREMHQVRCRPRYY